MMRKSTVKKLIKKVNRDVDKEMKKKYPEYKTREEINRIARKSQNRYDVMQIILLAQSLQSTGELHEEISKLSNQLPSAFDKFL